MSASTGKSPLETLKNFVANRWFDKEFPKFALRVATEFSSRNEILNGGLITKGSGTTDADQLNLAVTAGNVKLNGVISSIPTISNKEAVAGVSASIELTVAVSLPSYSGNSGEFEIITITSASKSFKLRLYDSDAAGTHDTSSDANLQLDISQSAQTRDTFATNLLNGLQTVFTTALGYSYSSVSNGVFTVIAPVGSGHDFVYEDLGNVSGLSESITNYSYSFGGLINQAGEAVTSALNASAVDYYITFVASNSNGSGGVNSSDASNALVHGILSSSSSHLSTQAINGALAASAGNVGNYDHSGVTGWCHVAQILFDSNALAGNEIVMNRNNAVSKA